jgi:predicted HicB family RNase H-like nuclease
MTKKKDMTESRMIHIRLSEEVHRLLRIRVAEQDCRIQEWVTALIEKELRGGKGK